MVRVVIDVERLKFLECGLGQYCLHLANAITALAGADLEPVFLTPSSLDEAILGANVSTVRASIWRRPLATSILRPILGRFPRRRETTIWHVTHQDSKFWPLDPRVPVVLTIHDLNFLREKSAAAIRRRLRRLQRHVDRCSVVTTGSEYAAREIRDHLELHGKEIRVIPHGVCLRREATSLKPVSVPSNARFLFTIGDLTPKKNFHVLVDLIARLPELQLVIAGNNSTQYARDIAKRAAELNVDDRLFMIGRVSEGERLWLYEHCQAFVFPSLSEGFGLPVIEAMSFGRPVFCSNRTSLPEVGGDLAFYWESFEAESMAQVLSSGLATIASDGSFGDRLRRRAAEFNWPVAAKRYFDLYREVTSERTERLNRAA